MQQVAEEAGMSAGNLYRYFPSKEALVEGICLLDQRERGAAFHALAASDDVLGTLEAMLRDNLLNKPRHKAVMFLEVAAEAGRNPRIAEMMRTNDAEVIAGLTHLVETAKANGEAVAVPRCVFRRPPRCSPMSAACSAAAPSTSASTSRRRRR